MALLLGVGGSRARLVRFAHRLTWQLPGGRRPLESILPPSLQLFLSVL
jgi:hypothetical protein